MPAQGSPGAVTPCRGGWLTVRLKAAGYAVAVASDAVQSVGAVRRERPDIVLLAIGLPGGDGYVVLRRLKALVHIPAVPIIAVSGRADETERERMLGDLPPAAAS